MRELDLPVRAMPKEAPEEYLTRIIGILNEASRDRPEITATQPFTFENFTPGPDDVITLDPSTVTVADLAKAFATLVSYFQKQGPRRF